MLMEDVVPVVKMFACFDSVKTVYIIFICGDSILFEKGYQTF